MIRQWARAVRVRGMRFLLFFILSIPASSAYAVSGDARAFYGVVCSRYLLPAPASENLGGLNLREVRMAIDLGAAGKIDPKLWVVRELETALRRQAPGSAGPLIRKLEGSIPFTANEHQVLDAALTREYREYRHISLQSRAFHTSPSVVDYGAESFRNPSTALDRAWVSLGFRNEGDEVIRPTYREVAVNLRRLQDRFHIPTGSRLELTADHLESDGVTHRYYALDEPIPDGRDLPTDETYLTTPEFFRLLDQNKMTVQAGSHDLAHAIVWTVYPAVLDALRALAHWAFAHPNDEALSFRLEWASEALVLPDTDRVTEFLPQFRSREAWRFPMSISDRWTKIRAEIAATDPAELEIYAAAFVARYRKLFVPYGGAQAQYGEMERTITNAPRQLERYYLDRFPVLEWTHRVLNKTFHYSGRDILEEQPNQLADELRSLISDTRLEPDVRLSRIRDTVGRMELILGSLSGSDPVRVLHLFGDTPESRRASDLAEVLRITRGEHSTLYRVLTD